MPLLRGVARTAVIAGTATAVSNRVSRRQAGRWSRDAEQQQPEPQYAPPEPPPAPPQPSSTDTMIAQLKQLAELHDAGVLTDEEFAAQKQKILNPT